MDLSVLGTVSASPLTPKLDPYTDADLACDPMTMKSYSGNFILINDKDGGCHSLPFISCTSWHAGVETGGLSSFTRRVPGSETTVPS